MHPLTVTRPITKDFALVLLASLIIALSGQISIPLWFTPVPITLQNSTVLLMAAFLGARRGTAATLLFLTQGACGLPVFANGHGGLLCFFGPTGGYLCGYLIASYVVGTLIDQRKSAMTALLAGNLTIYLCGASYLAAFIGPMQALLLGIVPFIFGDLLKGIASLKLLEIGRQEITY